MLLLLWAVGCVNSPNDTDLENPLDPDGPSTPGGSNPAAEGRRFDCSGLDPADPAPLGGRVALTFDDGPHPEHTPAIVELLRSYDAPATFFVVGEMLANPEMRDLVDDLVEDPAFELANHTWSHPNLTTVSAAVFDAEIDDSTELIETFGTSPTFFRFPFGASTCDAVDGIAARGLRSTGWHIDTADWCYAALGETGVCTAEDYWRVPAEYEADMLGFTMEQVRRFDGGVILLHDIHAYTVESLAGLLDALAAEDFEVVPLSDSNTFPRLNAGNPADLPYLGEACNPDADQCWQIEYASWCAPTSEGATTGICTLDCEGLCPDRPGAATTFCATVEPGAGQCIGRADSENRFCQDLPGTEEVLVERWLGESGAPAASVSACLPDDW